MDYSFKLTGKMPLIKHRDDVMAADEVTRWRKDAKNQSTSKAGDDRSPAWTWMTYFYSDVESGRLVIPQENLMVALRTAGAKIPLSRGRGTFKSLTQSGLLIETDFLDFTSGGEPVLLEPILKLRERPFAEQFQAVKALGFELLVKRAKVGNSKHIRVRPMFRNWSVAGTLTVTEPAITPEVLAELFELAGRFAGLCDWRPSSAKSPGPYGTFTSEVKPLKARRAA